MTEAASSSDAEQVKGHQRMLGLLLAAAMFVLVVDTSLMNVSISAVVRDLGTTVSGVQSAIALEALVSAAFILIGGKVGDLIGRKRAYVLGLLGYAVGALAMALAQSLTAVIIFWAVVGGIGASLLLPAMQSLIHGNFEGAAQKQVYALVGAAAAIAAAVGPLLGGFITTYLSWRVGFLLEVVIIAVVLSCIKLVRDVPYTGPRTIDLVGALLSVLGMGGLVLGILAWQEGGESVGALLATGAIAMAALVYWLVRRKRAGKPTLIDPDLFTLQAVQARDLPADAAADRPGRRHDRAADLSADGAGVQRDAGRPVARPALAQHVRGSGAGREEGRKAPPGQHHPAGFVLLTVGIAVLIPIVPRAEFGWALMVPLLIAGSGLGLLVSQLNNYTLAPISEERVSEAAGVNSAAGSFGLSFGLAFAGAIMLAALSFTFTNMAEASTVLPPAEQQQVAQVLEDERGTDDQHPARTSCWSTNPQRSRTRSSASTPKHDPFALQVALLIPLLAGLIGLFNSFRMMRLPDPTPSGAEGMTLG